MTDVGTLPDDAFETEIDGIPAFWRRVEGPLVAALMFRVGRADEQLARGGISHLVEHLVLYPIGRKSVPYSFNGYVDPVSTVFHAGGEPDDVAGFLRDVCAAIGDLPLDRLEVEKGILRSEAAQHGLSPLAASLRTWRYGARGFGLPAYEQYGLHALTPDEVAGWSASRFTRASAVLWFSGEPPAGLRLDLPQGCSSPAPGLEVVASTPAWYAEPGPVTGALGAVARSSAANALVYVLQQMLVTHLRYDLGVSYSPQVTYEPANAGEAEVWAFLEQVEGTSASMATELHAVLARIAGGDVPEQLVEQWCRQGAMFFGADPGAQRGRLHMDAWNRLVGAPRRTAAELRAEQEAVDVAAVAQVGQQLLDSMLYRVPAEEPPPAMPVGRAPDWSLRRYRGEQYPVRRMWPTEDLHRIELGDEGVTLYQADGNAVSIAADECEALVRRPDGRLMLVGADGFVLNLVPNLWLGGEQLAAAIQDRVPAERVVDLPLEPDAPPPPPEQLPEPNSDWQAVALAGLVVVILTVALAGLLMDGPRVGLVPVLLLVALIVLVRRIRRLRATRAARGLRGVPSVGKRQSSPG